MSKKIITILLVFILLFSFTDQVSADNKNCMYQGGSGAASYGLGKLNIINPQNSTAQAQFNKLSTPDLDCNGWGDVGYWPTVVVGSVLTFGFGTKAISDNWFTDRCSVNTNNVSTSKKRTYDNYKDYIKTSITYIDENKNQKTESIPNMDLGSECPQYLLVFVADTNDANNIQIFAGNDELKAFLESKVSSNPSYNYLVAGSKYKSRSQAADDSNGSEEEKQFDTCDGLLGTRVGGEYSEGTVGALLQQIFDYMKFAAIVLIFAFSVIDYAKAITAQDQEIFKKANQKLLKRIIFGVVFFLIPSLVDIILKVIDSSTCGIK